MHNTDQHKRCESMFSGNIEPPKMTDRGFNKTTYQRERQKERGGGAETLQLLKLRNSSSTNERNCEEADPSISLFSPSAAAPQSFSPQMFPNCQTAFFYNRF